MFIPQRLPHRRAREGSELLHPLSCDVPHIGPDFSPDTYAAIVCDLCVDLEGAFIIIYNHEIESFLKRLSSTNGKVVSQKNTS